MSFMIRAGGGFIFSFIGNDIGRLIAELQGDSETKQTEAYAKEVEYVLLAPHQAKALQTMQKYAPKQQVQELFELYEKANSVRPIDPVTAIRIAKKDILQPQEQKELHR
ncbi:MAG: hypothetical protein J6V11_03495 [Alphaproteobacteria bacterium]|nr:hypothetical protein [Alphaproteobacteria bacterium]